MDDFIGQQIKRTNRNLLVLGLVCLGLLAVIVDLNWRDVHNFVFGPFPTGAAELAAVPQAGAQEHFYLKVQGEKSFPTGMQVVDSENQNHVVGQVLGLVVGDHVLVIQALPSQANHVQFKGTIAELPVDIRNKIAEKWRAAHPDLPADILPYALDTIGTWNEDRVILTIGGVMLAALGLWFAGLGLRRQLQPEAHPLFSKLTQYGGLQDIRMRIDSEMRSEGGGEKFGKLHVTSNWLINAMPFKTNIMATRDVAWAYAKVTKHYHNGIPTGKTYSAIIRDSKGQSMEVMRGRKNSVPQMMDSLKRRMPWVVLGYTKELDQLWQHDKSKFFETVEKLRSAPATA